MKAFAMGAMKDNTKAGTAQIDGFTVMCGMKAVIIRIAVLTHASIFDCNELKLI